MVSDTPPVMGAMRLHLLGDPTSLEYEEVAVPSPENSEVLVRVHAAAITRDELSWPDNRLPAIPSYELSGVVVTAGPEASRALVGQAVYGMTRFDRDGAAAHYVAVEDGLLAPKPRSLSHVEAAALSLAGLSAWQGLLEHGGLAPGERVLIQGAAGGVGSLAVQLAHSFGAQVVGAASEENLQVVKELGADAVVNATGSFEDAVGEVDLVFDTVGGTRLERSVSLLREGGRLISVAAQPPVEEAAARGLRATFFVVEPEREELMELGRLVDAGKVRPIVDRVFPLREARRAFEHLAEPRHRRGKVVLQVEG